MGKRGGAGIALALACVALASSLAAAAGQEPPERTISRTPAEGPPGTEIALSGTGCLLFGNATEEVFIFMSSPDSGFYTSARFPVAVDGTWSGRLTVPAEAPTGNYRISADCVEDDQVIPGAETDFRVLQGAVTTTTTTPPSTTTTGAPTSTSSSPAPTTTATTTATSLPLAQPAVAVRAQPRFTG